jgi:hypothetical protein
MKANKETLHSFIDHGNGELALRIQDPFVFDSGQYSCIITTAAGDCKTYCDVEIEETFDNLSDVIPEFTKLPLPAVALHGNSTSFCTRVTPVDSDVIWSVCGREITDDVKDYAVSFNLSISISKENLIDTLEQFPSLASISINFPFRYSKSISLFSICTKVREENVHCMNNCAGNLISCFVEKQQHDAQTHIGI